VIGLVCVCVCVCVRVCDHCSERSNRKKYLKIRVFTRITLLKRLQTLNDRRREGTFLEVNCGVPLKPMGTATRSSQITSGKTCCYYYQDIVHAVQMKAKK